MSKLSIIHFLIITISENDKERIKQFLLNVSLDFVDGNAHAAVIFFKRSVNK